MTLGVVKKNEQDFADWVSTEDGFLEALVRFDDDPLTLEAYQLAFLRNRNKFRWVNKSRQVGYSFVFACEAMARCHLRNQHNAIFVSYNLDDAKEKILIARQIHESLPLAFQKRLVVDSKTELAFESNGAQKNVSRILSQPSKAPRGKKGDIYLDEIAHYLNDRAIYTGSTALILRSGGQVTGASTPLGRRGIFWEIATQELRPYPRYTRQSVPWWLCSKFCLDTKRAAREADSMPTADRVAMFGTPDIIDQFDSLPIDDFQQEYECSFVDESYSYYPYELILPCTIDDMSVAEDISDLKRPEGRLVAGYDVGRTRDASELMVFEEMNGRFTLRLMMSFVQVPFSRQESELRRLLGAVPIARLSIDRNGIGMNLAENLSREFPQVVGETFTNASKERWATDVKILMQRRDLAIPRHRELVSQMHSIRRRVLQSGAVQFEGGDGKHHADKFWALALACQLERSAATASQSEVRVRVIG